jgi:heme-degrading monooxygenase HmoA
VIARTWRGETATHDADAYVAYLEATGLPGYRATPGNRGAYLLRRPKGDRTEFLTVSFWDDLDVIRTFAGDDIDVAVFYPEDDRYLRSRDLVAYHYEVASPSSAP